MKLDVPHFHGYLVPDMDNVVEEINKQWCNAKRLSTPKYPKGPNSDTGSATASTPLNIIINALPWASGVR